MSKFVKPNIDRIFYLFSDKATKSLNGSGVITSTSIYPLAIGSGYTSTGSVATITGGSGSGASITPIITGSITSVNVVNGGSGYTFEGTTITANIGEVVPTKFPRRAYTSADRSKVRQSSYNDITTYPPENFFNNNISDWGIFLTEKYNDRVLPSGIILSLNGINTYFPDYAGEYLMVDVEEQFKLTQIIIRTQNNNFIKRPGIFRIYGTNDTSQLTTPVFTSGWTLIHDQTTIEEPELYDYRSNFSQTKKYDISTTQPFSVYCLVVNQVGGDSHTLSFSELQLLGIPTTSTSAILEPVITGGITSITVLNGGSGYIQESTSILFTNVGFGIDASCTATVVDGVITGIVMVNNGTNYTKAVVINIQGVGTGASAVAIITGSITSVNIINGGDNYTSYSTLSVIGDGTGAILQPTITGGVSSYIVNNGGKGFLTAPTLSVSIGTGATSCIDIIPERVFEYRWDIPDISLNDVGKLSLINRVYKTMSVTTTPIITRVLNISSKEHIDTRKGNGLILDTSAWNYLQKLPRQEPIYISPQVINSITLTIDDNVLVNGTSSGCPLANVFCIVLKLTEGDLDRVKYGSTNNINVNQRQIPYY